jgi:hypothetical protein
MLVLSDLKSGMAALLGAPNSVRSAPLYLQEDAGERTLNMMTRSGSRRRFITGTYSGCFVNTGVAVSSTSSTACKNSVSLGSRALTPSQISCTTREQRSASYVYVLELNIERSRCALRGELHTKVRERLQSALEEGTVGADQRSPATLAARAGYTPALRLCSLSQTWWCVRTRGGRRTDTAERRLGREHSAGTQITRGQEQPLQVRTDHATT